MTRLAALLTFAYSVALVVVDYIAALRLEPPRGALR